MPLGFGVVPRFFQFLLLRLSQALPLCFFLPALANGAAQVENWTHKSSFLLHYFPPPVAIMNLRIERFPESTVRVWPRRQEKRRCRENGAETVAYEKAALFALERHPSRRTLPVRRDRARARGFISFRALLFTTILNNFYLSLFKINK